MSNKQYCTKCGIEFYAYWLKNGECNGCRNPQSIVAAVTTCPAYEGTGECINEEHCSECHVTEDGLDDDGRCEECTFDRACARADRLYDEMKEGNYE